MVKPRIIETNEGIQGEPTVEVYDQFARIMRDKGWNNVDSILKSGITKGNVLEIGPGPGYIGLEWLKHTSDSTLTGCEISRDMIKLAEKNAREYGFEARTSYVEGNCMQMPLNNEAFDAVLSNGSMHEWEEPVRVFNEIFRVLKAGGLYCITDMRRDVNPFIKWAIYLSARPKEIRPGFLTSLNASYTVNEIQYLLNKSELKNAAVTKEFFGLCISGKKDRV
jgi:ubiquinone/menaquinone biosynthesis C-methylase UbiE